MCVCMWACMCLNACVFIWMCVCECMHAYLCVFVFEWWHLYVDMFMVFVRVNYCLGECVRICVCMWMIVFVLASVFVWVCVNDGVCVCDFVTMCVFLCMSLWMWLFDNVCECVRALAVLNTDGSSSVREAALPAREQSWENAAGKRCMGWIQIARNYFLFTSWSLCAVW